MFNHLHNDIGRRFKAIYKVLFLKKFLFMLMLLLSLCWGSVDAADQYQFSTYQQSKLFNRLTGELRCLVCQNESLSDSNAPLANDLRLTLYRDVQRGDTHQQIIHSMTAKYGDFILFKPPVRQSTALLWFGPALFLFIGFLVLFRLLRRKRK